MSDTKCTAADGKTEVFDIPGYPLMVRAVDFNAALAHTGQAAPAGEVPPLPTEWKTIPDSDGMPVKVYRAFQMRDYYARARANPATEPAAPGYVSVPVEPTEAMLMAGARSIIDGNEKRMGTSWGEEAGNAYRAMLAAASTVQGKEKP